LKVAARRKVVRLVVAIDRDENISTGRRAPGRSNASPNTPMAGSKTEAQGVGMAKKIDLARATLLGKSAGPRPGDSRGIPRHSLKSATNWRARPVRSPQRPGDPGIESVNPGATASDPRPTSTDSPSSVRLASSSPSEGDASATDAPTVPQNAGPHPRHPRANQRKACANATQAGVNPLDTRAQSADAGTETARSRVTATLAHANPLDTGARPRGSKQKKAIKGAVTGILVTPVTAPQPVETAPSSPSAHATGAGTTAAPTPHTA
jgi:hypothetical protein